MELINQIYESLKIELEITEGERFNPDLLLSKVRSAYNEVKTYKKYPMSCTEAYIEHDMENYYSQIRNIAMYDFNIIGAEWQTSYSQDGVSVHYGDRDKLFYGIIPYAVRG